MGPNSTPEQPPRKSMREQAREAAEQIVAEIRTSYNDRYATVDRIQDQDERIRQRALLDQEISNQFRQKAREQLAREASDTSQTDTPETKQEKAKNAKRLFLEAKELSDKGTNIVDRKSQGLIDKIVEKIKTGEITDQGALAIERNLGKQLIDGVVFSKPGEQLSSTEEGFKNLLQVDPQTANQLLGTIAANPETYGTTAENLIQKLGLPEQEPQNTLTPEQQQMINESRGEDNPFIRDKIQYYQSRFTEEQLNLIEAFYSPEKFINYIEHLSNGDDNGGKNFLKQTEVQERKQEVEHHIKEYYNKNNRPLSEGELKDQVEKHWGEEVSEMMNWKVSDIVNQLFLELQQKSPHKF